MDWSIMWGGQASIVIAGGLGGVVRWLTLREQPRDGATSVVVGAICAHYLGPLAIPAIEPVLGKVVLSSDARESFSAFVVGIGGVTVSGLLVDVWRFRLSFLRAKHGTDEDDRQGTSSGGGPRERPGEG